ncbi:MAG: hypothetical protein EP332_11070 [Bacteroidetes bacterium]|nr:MAG: hypothetical protein EP332_11070 [Bacteroidota bacterium]
MRKVAGFSLACIAVLGFCLCFSLAQLQLGEGYNVFAPFIDTEFAKGYTPAKFDLVDESFSPEKVLDLLGEPLFSV